MKAYIVKSGVFSNGPDRVFLSATNAKDREDLAWLVDNYQLTNAGKDGTDEWQHVAIELKPKEQDG